MSHARSIGLITVLFIYLALPVKLAGVPQQLAPITVAPFYPPNHDTQQKTDHNTGNYVPYS